MKFCKALRTFFLATAKFDGILLSQRLEIPG